MTTTNVEMRRTVHDEPGRFAGWPANYGMWAFKDEVVLIFVVGHVGPLLGVHARDLSRPFSPVVARSHDRGHTWQIEEFSGHLPGAASLSGDEHLEPELQALPRIGDSDFTPLVDVIDFEDPETMVLCARTGLHEGSLSWFYVSRDRGRKWSGPHALPSFDQPGLSARTDVISLGKHEALFMLTAVKSNGREGRVFAAYTNDGGRTFEKRGWLGPEPDGMQIMPSSIRLDSGRVLTSVRCHSPKGDDSRFWIDVYRSDDAGLTWAHHARAVDDTGPSGNPSVLLRDGSLLICVYGYRGTPSGLRCVTSTDEGTSWSEPVVVTDDSPMKDMGYPRAVVLDDGSVLACFYNNRGDESERYIDAVKFTP